MRHALLLPEFLPEQKVKLVEQVEEFLVQFAHSKIRKVRGRQSLHPVD